jgi:hypothetical protein
MALRGAGSGHWDPLIDIKLNDAELRKLEMMLRGIPNALPKVISRGINRAASPTKGEISKGIREEINATAKRVNERLKLTPATYQKWFASIHISSARLPLMTFGAKRTAKGVSYKIKKDGGRQMIPHTFIAGVTTGHEDVEHKGVFVRRGKVRLPIRELWGPSIGAVFQGSELFINRIKNNAVQRLEHNINEQIKYLMSLRRTRGAA